jgi:hypothetical protein
MDRTSGTTRMPAACAAATSAAPGSAMAGHPASREQADGFAVLKYFYGKRKIRIHGRDAQFPYWHRHLDFFQKGARVLAFSTTNGASVLTVASAGRAERR